MEFPNLGKHCSDPTCKQLDYLPLKCDACENIFCKDHIRYSSHNCPSSYKKNVQVPVCPLCNVPIPVKRGEPPDIAVGAHIDSDCQSDPAKSRRKIFTNKCSAKGCRGKEVVPVTCAECKLNFCLKHRHPVDHQCEGQAGAARRKAAEAAMARHARMNGTSAPVSNTRSNHNTRATQSRTRSIQGSLSEDEALAQALALSLQETSRQHSNFNQNEKDPRTAQLVTRVDELSRLDRSENRWFESRRCVSTEK